MSRIIDAQVQRITAHIFNDYAHPESMPYSVILRSEAPKDLL
jgi:hypothetical protein